MENVKLRSSNIELYRIVVMFLILVHHYFVNSGLAGVAEQYPLTLKTIFLHFWGMWGHIGTNGFVLITGYFMCRSQITLKKFLKLFLQIEFYNVLIYSFFVLIHKTPFSIGSFAYSFFPIHGVNTNFVDCYLLFFLFIPFLNILINGMSMKQHGQLVLLTLAIYTILAKVPGISVSCNYVTWFMVIYMIGSYIRLYPIPYKNSSRFWLLSSVVSILVAYASILFFLYGRQRGLSYPGYTLLMAANAPFALLVGVCTFMLFRNISIPYNKAINAVGGATFGVLLIHANSETMRLWLWHDVFRNVDYFYSNTIYLHAILVPIFIFTFCSLFDILRIKYIEKPLLNILFGIKTIS